MQRERIVDVLSRENSADFVTVAGWVRSKRGSKNVGFIVVNDGSSQEDLQIVVDAGSSAFEALSQISTGCSVKITGALKESQGKQQWELLASSIEVLGSVDADYPLQKKGHSLDFLREIGHLRPRSNTFGAVFRVRNCLANEVHKFFQSRGFLWVHTPITTASDCEGAGEMFRVTQFDKLSETPKTQQGEIDHSADFFGKKAHLTVSGQLEAEFMASALGDVYTFGPTFRAENSNTSRHLAEFWMIEPEMAFAELKDDMTLAEDFIRYVIGQVVLKCEKELRFLERHYKSSTVEELAALSKTPFQKISYTNAIRELEKANSSNRFEYPVQWGNDLQSEHERFLAEELFAGPCIVVDYPKAIKPFYMRVNNDNKTVAAMDVLIPKVGELVGGSQREERFEVLQSRMEECQIDPKEMWWYSDLRRYGTTPHSGFGLGFERLVQYVTGMANIRDVIPCPRAPNLIEF